MKMVENKERRKSIYREPVKRALNELFNETREPVEMEQMLVRIKENEEAREEAYKNEQREKEIEQEKGKQSKDGQQKTKKRKKTENNDFVTDPKQSSVWRNLETLIEDGEALRVDGTKGYLPNTTEACRTIMSDMIAQNVNFEQNTVHRMSPTTFLLDVKGESMDMAKQLFRNYLGPEHCFGVLEFNGYLMLLVKFEMNTFGEEEKEELARQEWNLYCDVLDIVQKACERMEEEGQTINWRIRKRSDTKVENQEEKASEEQPKEEETETK